MKMRLAWILAVGSVLLLGWGLFVGSKLQENRSLRLDKARLAEAVQALEGRVAWLASITNHLAARLVGVEAERQASALAASNAVVALAAQKAGSISSAAADPVVPRAYQVPVYLGNRNLGLAWAIPTNVRRDAKTGLYACEQMIRLPEEARGSLTTYVTNVVEQLVYGPAEVIEREVYVDGGGYGWVWPHAGHGGQAPVDPGYGRPPTVRPPTRPPPQVSPNPSQPGIYVPPNPGQPGIFVPPGLR